jgi:hypothetical protein
MRIDISFIVHDITWPTRGQDSNQLSDCAVVPVHMYFLFRIAAKVESLDFVNGIVLNRFPWNRVSF